MNKRPHTWEMVLFAFALALAVIITFTWARYVWADDYLKWAGVTSAKLQKATGREKQIMAQEAAHGYYTHCMDYGVTQDCDLAVTNRVQTCIEYEVTGADGESWRAAVCRPRGAQTEVVIRAYTPCAQNTACGKVSGRWSWAQ